MFSANGSQVSSAATYIEDVFSTYLYTGNGSTQTITNNIDLSTKGGLVWGKIRSTTGGSYLFDTARGENRRLQTDSTAAQDYLTSYNQTFSTTGFALNNSYATLNANGSTYVSWTFRKQPKFFDVVTYTGNGGTAQTISHNLGSTPGCMIIKISSGGSEDWVVWHRSLSSPTTEALLLNTTDAAGAYYSGQLWNGTAPTSTGFTVKTANAVNTAGATYVAYLFAHNAGGFGLTGTDNVISCGSFTTDGSGNATVSLGYEPQFLLTKKTNDTSSWLIHDNMRALNMTSAALLYPNLSVAETIGGNPYVNPTPTGFNAVSGLYSASSTYIYIAIRRGPMKVPTDATKVFEPYAYAGSGTAGTKTLIANGSTLQASDLFVVGSSNTVYNKWMWGDRLRGAKALSSNNTYAENGAPDPIVVGSTFGTDTQKGFYYEQDYLDYSGRNYIAYKFKRAPSFFDVVCYTGTGSATTVTHNLGAAPEFMIIRRRDAIENWFTYTSAFGPTKRGPALESGTDIGNTGSGYWNNTAPTSSVFSLGTDSGVNLSGSKYVAYLFATCAGVSKVGSYTGTGVDGLQINCGFSSGARFVLIRRTDSGNDWHVFDTTRGINAGADPYLKLNTTGAEVTTDDIVDAYSAGFVVNAFNGVNANGGTYIYLAIA